MGYNDFHFFGHLTKELAGKKKFATDSDFKQVVTRWLHTRCADSLYPRIQALVPRSDKRLMSVAATLKSGVYHLPHMCTSKPV